MIQIYEVFDASTEQLLAELGGIQQQLKGGALGASRLQ